MSHSYIFNHLQFLQLFSLRRSQKFAPVIICTREICPCLAESWGGCVAERLTPRTLDLEVRGSILAHRVVSLDKELYSTLSLFTQVYKWVPATRVTLRWTSIPSMGEWQYS